MPTDCNTAVFDFLCVEGCHVAATLDGGRLPWRPGARSLGQSTREIRMT